MLVPSIPSNEQQRLTALWKLHVLDTKPEKRFDRITEQATIKLRVPISTISLIDKNREWYKSCQGIGVSELPRKISFCAHAILSPGILIVEDTREDARFADNPQVTQPSYIRFYAGIPLRDFSSSMVLGVLCVKDIKPRHLSDEELDILFELAKEAERELSAPQN